MKDTTVFFLLAQLFETARLNIVKLCSYEGHNMYIWVSTGNFDCIFFLEVTPFLNLEIWQKGNILLFFLLAQLL